MISPISQHPILFATQPASDAGEKRGQASLLGRDEPTIWFEALDALAPLDIKGSIPQIDEWALEERRNTAEAALENEAEAFERDLGESISLETISDPAMRLRHVNS